jgi:GNAT superfamily N-acetyltransferase
VSTVKRIETMEDVERLIALGRKMHAESPVYKDMDFDEDRVRAYGKMALENPKDWGVFFVDDDGETVAMVSVFVAPKYFSGKRREASDMLLYAEPSRRGGMAAFRCMKAVEKWAKENGVQAINMAVSAGIDDETAIRFYDGMGYKKSAVTMTKEIV